MLANAFSSAARHSASSRAAPACLPSPVTARVNERLRGRQPSLVQGALWVGPENDAKPAKHRAEPGCTDFTVLECSVITLARLDAAISAYSPRWQTKLLAMLFGIRTANQLASPRLEALRRVAILVRLGRLGGNCAAQQTFADEGFTSAHLGCLREIMAPNGFASNRAGRTPPNEQVIDEVCGTKLEVRR